MKRWVGGYTALMAAGLLGSICLGGSALLTASPLQVTERLEVAGLAAPAHPRWLRRPFGRRPRRTVVSGAALLSQAWSRLPISPGSPAGRIPWPVPGRLILHPAPAVPVVVAEARLEDMPVNITSVGTVQAYDTVNVQAKIDDYITQILPGHEGG